MTPPPTKYADAPGTASRAAEINPPADESDTATVSLRVLRSAPSVDAIGVSSCIGYQALSVNFWKVWQSAGAWPRLTANVHVTSLT